MALYIVALIALIAVVEALRNTGASGISQGEFGENRGPRADPLALLPPARSEAGVFRVGSFNVHMGKPIDSKPVMRRMMSIVAAVDILGMQEVPGGGWDGTDNQATMLARTVGQRHWLVAPARLRWRRPHGGNAVISARQPLDVEVVQLAGNHKDFRNLIRFDIEINGVRITCINTHLSHRFPQLRQRQYNAAISHFLKAERAILMADLNMTAADAVITDLLKRPDVVDAMAVIRDRDNNAELKPDTEIDWILLRGLQVLDAGRLPPGISDHPMIWADLRVNPDT